MRVAGAFALAGLLAVPVGGSPHAQELRRFVPLDVRGAPGLPSCNQIACTINRAVQGKHPGALLSAGWMHERGHCVAVDVDKAFPYHTAAFEQGETAAAERMAGLASTREGGQALEATLWWARRSKWKDTIFGTPGACEPMPGQVAQDEDQFVTAVTDWPQERALNCLAMVGLRSLSLADMRYNSVTLREELQGKAEVRYELQQGTYTVTPGAAGDGDGLAQYVEQVLDDAMHWAPRTTEVTRGGFTFVFRLSY